MIFFMATKLLTLFMISTIILVGCCRDCEIIEVFNSTEFKYINITLGTVDVQEMYKETDSILISTLLVPGDTLIRFGAGWGDIAAPFSNLNGNLRVRFDSELYGCWEYRLTGGRNDLGTGVGPFDFYNYIDFDSLAYVTQKNNELTYLIDSVKLVEGVSCQ